MSVFQRDPLLSGAIAYNILTDRKDIIKPIGFHRESTTLNDTDMKYLLLYLEETYGLTNEKKIDNAIGIVAAAWRSWCFLVLAASAAASSAIRCSSCITSFP